MHGIVEVSSTGNQIAYSIILGLAHTVLYTDLVVQRNNAVSLVDFFSNPFGVDTRRYRF